MASWVWSIESYTHFYPHTLMNTFNKLSLLSAPALGLFLTVWSFVPSSAPSSVAPALQPSPSASESADEVDEDDEDNEPSDLRDLLPQAKLTLQQAITNALKVCPGQAVEACIERMDADEGAALAFGVTIVGHDAKLHEIALSVMDGALIEDEVESNPRELSAFQRVLRHSEVSLADLISASGKLVIGQPGKAELEWEGINPLCEVTLINGRNLVEVTLESRAGHIVELQLADFDADESEEWQADRERHASNGRWSQDDDDDHHSGDEDEDEDEDEDDDR